MATYKVIQDIEAEDKLLGPLTLRQFVYSVIVIVSGFIVFRLMLVNWMLALPLLPHTLFFALLAMPFGHDQSSEVWLLSKIRFFLKPRKRIWDQSGIQELVTITAPKKPEHQLTKSLTQTEVRSRLRALADTIDSRGWSVKNLNVNLYSQSAYIDGASDRLVDASELPQEVSGTDVNPFDDILDEQTSPTAQNLSRMMAASTQAIKNRARNNMKMAAQQNTGPNPDYWFLNQSQADIPTGQAIVESHVVMPGQSDNTTTAPKPSPDEEALLEQIHQQRSLSGGASSAFGNLKTIMPLSQQPPDNSSISTTQTPPQPPKPAAKTKPDPEIMELATNDDLNVETIARQANKKHKNEPPANEVIINLH